MDPNPAVPARSTRTSSGELARRILACGGRYSLSLGIDVGAGDAEIERWFMATTLFGARIPTTVAERTFHVLDEAGVTPVTARAFSRDDLVALLDRGGYTRYGSCGMNVGDCTHLTRD
jgi:hypothetical protein